MLRGHSQLKISSLFFPKSGYVQFLQGGQEWPQIATTLSLACIHRNFALLVEAKSPFSYLWSTLQIYSWDKGHTWKIYIIGHDTYIQILKCMPVNSLLCN